MFQKNQFLNHEEPYEMEVGSSVRTISVPVEKAGFLRSHKFRPPYDRLNLLSNHIFNNDEYLSYQVIMKNEGNARKKVFYSIRP